MEESGYQDILRDLTHIVKKVLTEVQPRVITGYATFIFGSPQRYLRFYYGKFAYHTLATFIAFHTHSAMLT